MTPTFIHPQALCESDAVGDGTRVWAFAHVTAGARVGADCNICGHAYIEDGVVVGDRVTVKNGVMLFHGVTIEDDVFLGPGVIFTNDLRPRAHRRLPTEDLVPTTVQQGATLGAGVIVVCGVTVGRSAFAAAGSVITRDVPPFAIVAGNPAKQTGWACECGQRLDGDRQCPSCHVAGSDTRTA